MMKVCYSELDGPEGLSCRLEAAGHAGFAPAGQDIVCAGASTLMQALVYLLAGEENAHADAWEEPDGPRLAVQADAPCAAWVQGAFELAKAGFTLLAERYPDNILRSSSCCLRRLGKQITDRPADTAIQLLRPVLQHIISPLHHVSPILALRIQHTSDRQFSSGPGVHKIHHHRGRAHICRRQERIFYVSRKRSRIHYCLFSVFCMSLGQNLCVLFPFP